MDPVHPVTTLQCHSDNDSVDVTSWVSVCPRGLWKVQKKSQRPVSKAGYDTCMIHLQSICLEYKHAIYPT